MGIGGFHFKWLWFWRNRKRMVWGPQNQVNGQVVQGGAPNFHHHKSSSSRTPECQVLFLLWGIKSHWLARSHWMVYYQEWPTLVVKLGWLVLNCIIFLWSLSLVGPQEQEHRSDKGEKKKKKNVPCIEGGMWARLICKSMASWNLQMGRLMFQPWHWQMSRVQNCCLQD